LDDEYCTQNRLVLLVGVTGGGRREVSKRSILLSALCTLEDQL